MVPTSGQHHSLIKQGITGLHRDSHYRPLEESSGGCLFVSQSSRCTVLNGLHVAVGHEAALIKSIPLPFLFTKIPPPPQVPPPMKRVKIYSYTNSSVHVANICLLILGKIETKLFGFKSPWQYLRPVQRSMDHLPKAPSEPWGGYGFHSGDSMEFISAFLHAVGFQTGGRKSTNIQSCFASPNHTVIWADSAWARSWVLLTFLIAILNYPPTNCPPIQIPPWFFFLSTSCWINKSWRDQSKQCISRG